MKNNHTTPDIQVGAEAMRTKIQEHITVAERMHENMRRDFLDYEYEGDSFDFEYNCKDVHFPAPIRLLSDFIYNLKYRDGIVKEREEAYIELFTGLKEETSDSKEREAIDFFVTLIRV